MELVYSLTELFVETINGLPLLAFSALAVAVACPLILWHELGHGLAALALTRGKVKATVGPDRDGPLWLSLGRLRIVIGPLFVGGVCVYDPSTLRRSGDEAWIAAAGPAASLVAAVGLWALALLLGPADDLGTKMLVLAALEASLHTLMSLLPIRYALGSGAAGGESDGLAIWRLRTGGTGRIPVMTHGVETPSDRVAHPVVVIVLVLITGFTFVFMNLGAGLVLLAMFAAGWWLQTSDVRAGR